MGKVGSAVGGVSFVIAAGDNYYFNGVKDVHSDRFEKTWSNVYSAPSLQVPFLLVAGNHDHKGNVSAQIEYTTMDPTKRWTFPDFYHKQNFKDEESGVTLDVILIDTVQLCDMSQAEDESVPGYFHPLPLKAKDHTVAAADQWTWIENEMAASTADYLLVVGHFPVYSVCQHGPTSTLIEHLKPLLDKYNAHYVSGHDHCMNHFVDGATHHILSGMGDTCCYSDDNLNNPAIPAGALKWYVSEGHKPNFLIGGFTSFSLDESAMHVVYHDGKGDELYKADPVPKRKLSLA